MPLSGPAVDLSYPVDARPAGERASGGHYSASVPLPFVVYGDANLRPGSLAFVDRAARAGLAANGVPLADDGLDIDVYVLHFAGIRDISDAQWVSTLTGGLSGLVGKFLYPAFFEVRAQARIVVRNPDGTVRDVRDVEAFAIRKRPLALTWAYWSLFRRNVGSELFTAAFLDVQDQLAHDLGAVIDEARRDQPPVAGILASSFAYSSLDADWHGADSFDLRGSGFEDPFSLAKYGHARFSLWTGHDTDRGDVIGQVGIPIDTFGYDVGVHDRVQAHLDLTVLGFYNGASLGLRAQVIEVEDTKISLEGTVTTDVALTAERSYLPEVAALRVGGGAILSHRPKEVTFFAAMSGWSGHVYHEYPVFEGLVEGSAYGLTFGPGVEVQATPTVVIGVRVDAIAQFQNGVPVRVASVGPLVVVPQLAFGLR